MRARLLPVEDNKDNQLPAINGSIIINGSICFRSIPRHFLCYLENYYPPGFLLRATIILKFKIFSWLFLPLFHLTSEIYISINFKGDLGGGTEKTM